VAVGIERAEVVEEAFGAEECVFGGGVEPAEGADVFDAAGFEEEDGF
jgi:hypothetical protein